MGQTTAIQWSDSTWSPLRARVKPNATEIARAKGYTSLVQIAAKMAGRVGPHCESVSPGCVNCYSQTNNHRCLPSNGTGLPFDRRSRDLVDIFLDQHILEQPLHWKKPRRIFVNSQTDTFGEFVPFELIDRMFAIAALCPQHSFQFLTKRAERMSAYLSGDRDEWIAQAVECRNWADGVDWNAKDTPPLETWPLTNAWLGVSVEDRQRKSRIDVLRETPAALRFLSIEPLLEDIGELDLRGINWVIVGGESGPGARPFNVDWAFPIIEQCKTAQVACFVKQVGTFPNGSGFPVEFDYRKRNRSGSDPSEWPEWLRVREYPR